MIQPPEIPKVDTFIPTKADIEFCPLCEEKWTIVEDAHAKGHAYLACARTHCMIWIWVRDPMLGRYFKTESEQCPFCNGGKMRLFYRQDGYIKMLCPKCKGAVESVDPEKHQTLMKLEEAKGTRIMSDKPKEKEPGL